MLIGYQGIEGSNAEEAAKGFVSKRGLSNVELVPLVDAKSVIDELKQGTIDMAVVATRNTIGGTVEETFRVIKDECLQLVGTEIIPIHHCLFVRPGVSIDDIEIIASHPQALKQTVENRKKHFPNCVEQEEADTALSAKLLSKGVMDNNVAVLCRKKAGEDNGLELVIENMEDQPDNKTEFRVLKIPDIDYENADPPTVMDKIRSLSASEEGASKIAQLVMFLGIVAAVYLTTLFNQSPWEAAMTVGGYGTLLIVFFTSTAFRARSKYKKVTGYWKYYSSSNNISEVDKEQKISTPRIVKIQEVDGNLEMEGFMCDRENVPFFESKDIYMSISGKQKGGLVYFYGPPIKGVTRAHVGGIAHLEWITKYPAGRVNKMEGEYFGSVSKDMGTLRFLRITEEEYTAHKNSSFL